MLKGNKIKPFLWFENQAEEAARFYTSIFRDAKLGAIARYPEGSPGPAGEVMTVAFRIEGQDFVALNGGPQFKFSEAISFVVECEDQDEKVSCEKFAGRDAGAAAYGEARHRKMEEAAK